MSQLKQLDIKYRNPERLFVVVNTSGTANLITILLYEIYGLKLQNCTLRSILFWGDTKQNWQIFIRLL